MRFTTSRSRWAQLVGIAAVAPLVAVLGGCSISSPTQSAAACTRPTEKVIGFDFPLSTLSVYRPVIAAVTREAKAQGYKVLTTANNGDVQQQTDDLQTWITQKVPVIVSYALEPATVEPVAAQARANCLGFVSYGGPLKNMDAQVNFDWTASGRLQGGEAVKWARAYGKPVKALILKNTDIAAGKGRYDGLKSAFPGSASNIKVISEQKASDQQDGERVTSTVLQANPDLNMVIAYNDDVAMGARQAFLNAGKSDTDPNLFIAGNDGSVAGLKAVEDGTIMRATTTFSFSKMGAGIADTAIRVAKGEKTKGVTLDAIAVTSQSKEAIDEQLKLLQQK